jgi:TolB protein
MTSGIEADNKLMKRLVIAISVLLCLSVTLMSREARGKVYIDITSPRQQVIMAVSDLDGPHGREISDVIAGDLGFTGFFVPIEKAAFIERPGQPFSPENWSVLGAELVVKGHVRKSGETVSTVVTVYDVFDGSSVFKKLYRADSSLVRPLAHSISNDIYKAITGQEGVFRTKIAYVVKNKDRQGLHIMDWDGSRSRALGIKSSLILAPHWSRDGRKLLYSAERNRKWAIYLLDFDEGVEQKVFDEQGTNIAGDFFPGGEEFALSSSREGTPDIYLYDLRSSRLKQVTSLRGIAVSPSVSPDGGSIAFVSDRGGTPQIYTTDKIGYNMSRITYSGSYNTSPEWSPRGDRLAFSGRHKGRNQIFTVKPDGTGLMMLTEAGNNENPSFSPDGRFIAFTSDRDGGKGIWIMRANGEGQRRITPWGLEAFGPGWSPK